MKDRGKRGRERERGMVGGEGGRERREVGGWAIGEKNREEEECSRN